MADEFVKGLGIFAGAGLAWMVLAGWYQTPSFESTRQLIEAAPDPGGLFDAIAITLIPVFLWFTLIGMLTFWVLLPAGREVRKAYSERRSN